jgi:integrase
MVLPSFLYIANSLQINRFHACSAISNNVFLDEVLSILRHRCGTREEKMKVNFTKQFLTKCSPPSKGRTYYHDIQEKGLSAYITSNGVITFFVRKRIHGKDERIHLGNFPELSIENARKKALAAKADVAKGIDPTEEKKRLKEEITFGEMFHEFMERYSKKFKKSWTYDEREVKRFLSHFFHRKACQITKIEILELHEKIGHENGLYQANRLLERIRAIYNKAIEWGWKGVNPAIGIKKFKEKSRQRFLRKDEIPRFFKALAEEENPTTRDFVLLSLLTGARKSNVLAMQWEEVNFSLSEWHIKETKNGEAHVIPLTGPAIEILQARKKGSESVYVFPGKGAKGHLVDPKKAWKRILRRADIADLRIHDLRRTLGSWMGAVGATTAIIGKTLAHKSVEATKVYERIDIDPVREFITRANDAIFKAAYAEQEGNSIANGITGVASR